MLRGSGKMFSITPKVSASSLLPHWLARFQRHLLSQKRVTKSPLHPINPSRAFPHSCATWQLWIRITVEMPGELSQHVMCTANDGPWLQECTWTTGGLSTLPSWPWQRADASLDLRLWIKYDSPSTLAQSLQSIINWKEKLFLGCYFEWKGKHDVHGKILIMSINK